LVFLRDIYIVIFKTTAAYRESSYTSVGSLILLIDFYIFKQ